MSIILGIYSKQKKIKKKKYKEVINDFSLNNKRKINLKLYNDKLILANTITEYNDSIIMENINKSKTIAVSGIIHGNNIGSNGAKYILDSSDNLSNNFLKSLDGNFVFALYDLKKDKLLIINDSFGTYPLFFYDTKDYIIFCNEYDPIVKYKKFDKKINHNAVAEYISLGMPLEEKTFFKSIINTKPASLIEIEKNSINKKTYDDLNISLIKNNNINYHASNIIKTIKKTISHRYREPSKIIMALTGGADSRLILNFLSLKQRKEFEYLTCKSLNLTENEDRDVLIAKIIAEKFKLNHKILNSSLYKKEFNKNYFQRRRHISNIKKYIGGINGGELLGGCGYSMCPINLYNINKIEIKDKLNSFFTKKYLKNIYDPYINLMNSVRKIHTENKLIYFNIMQLIRGFFTNIYGGSRANWLEPYYVLIREDSIFFDTIFLRQILTIPDKYLNNYFLYNYIYKNYIKKSLSEIPSNSLMTKIKNYKLKPYLKGTEPKIARRPKYLKSLKKYLNSEKTWDRNIYNYNYIKSIINNEQHPQIRAFIDLEAWFRYYID